MTEGAGGAATPPSRQAAIARLTVIVLVVAAGLTLILTIGITRPEAADAERSPLAAATRPQPNAAVPARGVAAPVDRLHASDAAELRAWSRQTAVRTQIPARAVQAYGLAEMWMRSESPRCALSWSTLAGIGSAASSHGTRGGGRLDAEGVVTPALTGDRIGPLRMRLEAWRSLRFRAARDGKQPEPQNIDDAAVTAARHLCGQGDLSTARGWWSAVRAHGGSTRFAQDAFTAARAYARASNG